MDLNKLFNHDRYKIIFFVLAVIVASIILSCDIRLRSPVYEDRKLNLPEMEAEMRLVVAQYESKFKQFKQWEDLKNGLFNQALIAAETGTIDPFGLLLGLGTIFGLGAVIDDIRTRRRNGTSANQPPPSG